jgi:cytochrome c-type biogenesis protein
MTATVGVAAAFGAGIVSFLSPCVLPLVPAYVSFMTGMSLNELADQGPRRPGHLVPIALFVLGFTAVFVALGAGASAGGSLLSANRQLLTRVAGIVLVALGVVLLDIVPLPAMRGVTIDPARSRRFGRLTSLALGLAFPLALGPCAGPVYGAILTLAADSRNVATGSVLLLAYSAGLAVPFVLVAFTLHRAAGTLKWLAARTRLIRSVTGALVVALGLAMAAGVLDRATVWMRTLLPTGWPL